MRLAIIENMFPVVDRNRANQTECVEEGWWLCVADLRTDLALLLRRREAIEPNWPHTWKAKVLLSMNTGKV